MAESAAMPRRSAQRARCSGLEFDVMIVFMVLFWLSLEIDRHVFMAILE